MKILDYIFCFFFYSFIGWFFESCYCSFRPKKWINRGFLRGPMCPIYGTGAIVLLLVIIPLRDLTPNPYLNELVIFIVGLVVCDIVEFMTSLIMEKLFNARWWDYSGMRFNIQGRICLTHTLYWGVAACLFAYVIHPIIDTFIISQISTSSRNTIVYIILVVFAIDLIDTVIHALGIRASLEKFKVLSEEIAEFATTVYSNLENKVESITNERLREEFETKFNELSTRFDAFLNDSDSKRKTKSIKRLLRSFPYLKDGFKNQKKLIEDLLDDLKNRITKYKK